MSVVTKLRRHRVSPAFEAGLLATAGSGLNGCLRLVLNDLLIMFDQQIPFVGPFAYYHGWFFASHAYFNMACPVNEEVKRDANKAASAMIVEQKLERDANDPEKRLGHFSFRSQRNCPY